MDAEAATALRRRLSTMWEGALLDSANGQDFAETAGYRRLLDFLQALEPATVIERATSTLDRARAVTDPDSLRGQYVHVRGLIAGLEAVRLDTPLAGSEDVWRGVITDTDGSDGVVFDLLGPPPPLEPRLDIVDVHGIFYRTVRYENREQGWVEAPWLLARHLAVVDTGAPARQSTWSSLTPLLVILAVGFIGVRVFMLVRKHREGARSTAAAPGSWRGSLPRAAPRRHGVPPARTDSPPPTQPPPDAP
jgi:hypothetical protein